MRSVLKLGVVIVSLSFQTTAGFILRAPLLNPASPSLGQTAIAPPVAPLATAAITTAASPFTSPSVVSRQSVVRSSTLERPAASSPSASPSSVSNAQAAPLPTSERFIVLVEKPLGLVIEELDPSRPSQAGARIKSVRVDGCAAEAGVRAGDLLLAIDGETVAGRPFGEVIECMKSTGSGTADLELLRLPIGAYTDLEAADAAAASLRSVQFPLQSSYSSSSSPSFSRSESSSLSPLSSLSSSTAAPAVSFSDNSPMSQALPFLECPPLLRPSANAPDYVGNCGLDPLRLSKDRHSLAFYREAEIKHARLAMMAAAGWPVAELWDRQIAALFGLPNVLDANDGLNPALLNGGLFEAVNPYYWAAVLLATSAVEGVGQDRKRAATVTNKEWLPGDLGFDPLGFYPSDIAGRRRLQLAEIKHGRVAMVAVVGFAVQEAVLRSPVVDQTPFFFTPLAF